MTKQEAIQLQIDDIMDTFEFEEVHAWMAHDGWTWGSGQDSRIPDLYELKQCARERLKEAAKCGLSSTGGFTATRDEDTDENGPWIRLTLHFGYSSCNDGTSYTE